MKASSLNNPLRWFLAGIVVIAAIYGSQFMPEAYGAFRFILFLCALAIAAFCVYSTPVMQACRTMFQQAWVELLKVTWPSREDAIRTSLMVTMMVMVFALLMWLLDAGLTKIVAMVV